MSRFGHLKSEQERIKAAISEQIVNKPHVYLVYYGTEEFGMQSPPSSSVNLESTLPIEEWFRVDDMHLLAATQSMSSEKLKSYVRRIQTLFQINKAISWVKINSGPRFELWASDVTGIDPDNGNEQRHIVLVNVVPLEP